MSLFSQKLKKHAMNLFSHGKLFPGTFFPAELI